MKSFLLLATAGAAFLPGMAHAEDGKLDISFGARARVETIGGQFRANGPADDGILLLRTNLKADYDTGPIVIGGEIQDSRGYFESNRSTIGTSGIDALEPIQAYVATDFSDTFRAQAGRFTMTLGSGRLVNRPNFRNTVNTFDGIRLDLKGKNGTSGTVFYTRPDDRLPANLDEVVNNDVEIDRERSGYVFFGGYVQHKTSVASTIDASLYRLAEDDRRDIQTRNRHLWTADAHYITKRAPKSFDFELEGAYQFGHARATSAITDTTGRKVEAGYIHAATGYSFPVAWKPRLQFAFDYASGDSGNNAIHRFDTLFGSHTAEFGPSSLYNAVAEANLISPEVRVEVTPDKRWDGYAALRELWLASDTDTFGGSGVRDRRGESGRYAGTQLEGRTRYWVIPKELRAAAGAAFLFKGAFLKDAPNARALGDTTYGYVELTLAL